MKHVVFVFIGLSLSGLAYVSLPLVYYKLFGYFLEETIPLKVFLLAPLSVFIGSLPAGLFCHREIKNKLFLPLILAPVLYFNLLFITAAAFTRLLSFLTPLAACEYYGFAEGWSFAV